MFGLCSLRTNSCCCGISLRTGTIIILVLNLIGGLSVSAFINYNKILTNNYNVGFWIGKIIFNAIEVAALFGVFQKKPILLIPHLVTAAISLIIHALTIIILIILLPFATKVLADATYQTPDGKTEHLLEAVKGLFYVIYAVIIVVLTIYAAIRYHFFKVVLSYYVELKTVLFCVNPPTIGFVA